MGTHEQPPDPAHRGEDHYGHPNAASSPHEISVAGLDHINENFPDTLRAGIWILLDCSNFALKYDARTLTRCVRFPKTGWATRWRLFYV